MKWFKDDLLSIQRAALDNNSNEEFVKGAVWMYNKHIQELKGIIIILLKVGVIHLLAVIIIILGLIIGRGT